LASAQSAIIRPPQKNRRVEEKTRKNY